MNDKLMRRLRRLEWVPRWGVMPTIRKQNVAEHSFHVGVNCLWLLDRHKRRGSASFRTTVLQWALGHEEEEAVTGDLPSPTKPRSPIDPSDQEHVVLKCADYLEALQFIYVEQAMGNTMGMWAVRNDLAARLHDFWQVFEWEHPDSARKPITSDIIRTFELFAFDPSKPHPVLE